MKFKNAYEFAIHLLNMKLSHIRKKYEIIGEGTARLVVKYSDRIAIKIAKNIKGKYQNSAEDRLYNSSSNNFRKYLAKVYSHVHVGYTALIVRYYPDKVKKLYCKKWRNQAEKLEKLMRYEKIGDRDRPSSFRNNNNKLIIVDYGFDLYTKKLYWE